MKYLKKLLFVNIYISHFMFSTHFMLCPTASKLLLFLEKQYFLILCFLRVLCYFLFFIKTFPGGGGGGGKQKMVMFASEPVAGDLGRPICLFDVMT